MRDKLYFTRNFEIESLKLSISNIETHKSFEQGIICHLIHRYTNYENIMWSFYKNNKDYVMTELRKILLEISNADPSLSWDCLIIEKRYAAKYKEKHFKSKWVQPQGDLTWSKYN